MKKHVLVLLLVVSSLLSCDNGSNSNSTASPQSYEATKQSLADRERENPLEFLEVDGTYRQNLVDRWVLEGAIYNKASVAAYKDVVLHITYYSKTKTELGSEDKTIYEYFGPNTSRKFKIKMDGYAATESVNFEISSAVPAN
jgi:hypothetical protein